MTIELHTPRVGLHEAIVHKAKQAIMRLRHLHKAIARLECVMREDHAMATPYNKICELRVNVDGETLFTHARSDDYASASEEAMGHMYDQVALLAARQHDLPDQVTTTVKV
ncbi:hypothetical protein [Flavihumibacter petaseus]|uniref:Sigma-54 modulation protein n=1 Tax=Flavihumibacter petaseus NBRC 106054 TaxID=1220578 RepID=A0A0E9MYF2_9BACT|nr:hypothetical protein [Flavihumibacter petaseus]GAO42436.1 hypothetical protein FPE01S_01_14510 [Flavihumibacter petaseus NBRC 106054]